MKNPSHPDRTILVIEENADTAELVRLAFRSLESCAAFVCRNNSEAKAYLSGAGMYADRTEYPFPRALVSDLGSGDDGGISLLMWAKSQTECRDLPMYILTEPESAAQARQAKDLGAAKVFRKPASVKELESLLADLAAKLCDSASTEVAGSGHFNSQAPVQHRC